jgi:membrane protease YdiL (CAAX protease family)
MSDSIATIIEAAPTETQPERPADVKRLRWFEVSLVLLVACGSSFLTSLYVLRNGPSAMPRLTNVAWSAGIVQEAAALLLLGYVLSRRKLRFKDLGLRWSLRDVGVGLLIAGVSYVAYAMGYWFVDFLHYGMYSSVAKGPSGSDFFAHPSIVAVPFSILNPFFEELIVRAYLMTEVTDLTGSPALAVGLSVLVQFSYHLYYGWTGALALSFQFLIFALYYARSRRALPVIVAHGFFDIYSLIRLTSG